MSYTDYSSQFVLDIFFTYLHANQLGSNDKHIVDNFSTEHNWNASSADGTHKANSILGSTISKIPISTGSQAIGVGSSWIPSAGIYQMTAGGSSEITFLQIYVSGVWRPPTSIGSNGIVFCDGTNMRIYSASGDTVFYQKF